MFWSKTFCATCIRRKSTVASLLILGVLGLQNCAAPPQGATSQPSSSPAAAQAAPDSSDAKEVMAPELPQRGVVAAIDPDTGELVEPTLEQLEALAPAAPEDKSGEPLYVEEPLPGGGFSIRIPESMHSSVKVELKDDGTMATVCVDGHDHADHHPTGSDH
jgi:hypothetical protein